MHDKAKIKQILETLEKSVLKEAGPVQTKLKVISCKNAVIAAREMIHYNALQSDAMNNDLDDAFNSLTAAIRSLNNYINGN